MTTSRSDRFAAQPLSRRGAIRAGGLGVAAALSAAQGSLLAHEATPVVPLGPDNLEQDGLSVEVIELYDALPGTKALVFWAPPDAGRPGWSASLEAGRQLVIASAFKAFVLAEFLRQAEASFDPTAATPIAGQLHERLQEELVLDEAVFTLGSPILNPPNLRGKITARTAIEAMILESDDTATDMLLRRIGPEQVRGLIADLGLVQTRIPESTRQFIGYVFGDPEWRTLTWERLVPLVTNTPYPPRFALNDEITMASTAGELVAFYSRVLLGELFRYPETLTTFRAMLSLKDQIAQILPLGVDTFVKGGSMDAFTDHVLSAAGGMYVAERWVYFALILNWDSSQAGTVAEVGPAFTSVTHAAFTMIRDRLGA
ncbi:MAG: serine hydrolase [Thermomicrobiales bacterium]